MHVMTQIFESLFDPCALEFRFYSKVMIYSNQQTKMDRMMLKNIWKKANIFIPSTLLREDTEIPRYLFLRKIKQ